MSENPDFTINNAQLIRKALSIDEGIDVKKENWHSFRLSLINTIINQNSYDDIKHLNIPVDVVYGVLDQFLVQEVIKHIDVLGNVKVTRVQAADHTVGKRISRTVADLIKG